MHTALDINKRIYQYEHAIDITDINNMPFKAQLELLNFLSKLQISYKKKLLST